MAGTNYFIFNGTSSNSLNLMVDGLETYGAPGRRLEKVTVPGRNGDILIEEGTYENYIARYLITVKDDIQNKARTLANWLLSSRGYCRLEDSYNPNSYRMAAMYTNVSYAINNLIESGTCTLEFDCKPQRYLKSGEDLVSISPSSYEDFTNPTAHTALPLIYVDAGGSQFTVGTNVVTFTMVPDTIIVDCETMETYFEQGGGSAANLVTFSEVYYPEIPGGETVRVSTAADTTIEIAPRWWEL